MPIVVLESIVTPAPSTSRVPTAVMPIVVLESIVTPAPSTSRAATAAIVIAAAESIDTTAPSRSRVSTAETTKFPDVVVETVKIPASALTFELPVPSILKVPAAKMSIPAAESMSILPPLVIVASFKASVPLPSD